MELHGYLEGLPDRGSARAATALRQEAAVRASVARAPARQKDFEATSFHVEHRCASGDINVLPARCST